MSDETSVRLGLPLLQAGQAQKEMTHNEALTLLDMAVQATVEAVGTNVPPVAPPAGACWIVGPAPTGVWTGQANALAGWTSGGWRFVAAREGMAAWSRADGAVARFAGGVWSVVVRQAAIAGPAGGGTVDAEARGTLGLVLAALRSHGLIAR